MKIIANFISNNDNTHFLDLEDARLSLTVNPSGDLLLFEGDGENRINGMAVSGTSVLGFDIDAENNLFVQFKRGSLTENYTLGYTVHRAQALEWIDNVWKMNYLPLQKASATREDALACPGCQATAAGMQQALSS